MSTFTSFKPSEPAKPNSNQQQTNVEITAAVEIVWSLEQCRFPTACTTMKKIRKNGTPCKTVRSFEILTFFADKIVAQVCKMILGIDE